MRGLGREVKGLPSVETLLSGLAGDEETLARRLECSVQRGEERQCVLSEDLGLRLLGVLRVDLYAGDHGGL